MQSEWPDVVGRDPEPILCPQCLRQTNWAMNTDRYVCRDHGPVLTGEALHVALNQEDTE
jgi:hypothetical protein